MPLPNFKNRSVDADRYAMVPRSDVPRSVFRTKSAWKGTFDAGYLVPVYLDEVLPGDTHRVRMTSFSRLGTVLAPIMDNLHLESWFFFVPCRLVWDHWINMMGERKSPADSVAYVIPTVASPVAGWTVGSLGDYLGLPTVGQVGAGATITTSALPFRCYNLIWNEWFRDQTFGVAASVPVDDGPDSNAIYTLRKRYKRPDYFTTCLPWPQRDQVTSGYGMIGQAVPYKPGMSIATQIGAPVTGLGVEALAGVITGPTAVIETGNAGVAFNYDYYKPLTHATVAQKWIGRLMANGEPDVRVTINAIRLAFQAQRFMERDARGGQRYTETLKAHFGVTPQDSRLQRPEYLGGGHSMVDVSPVSQQSATGVTGSTTPLGHLSAVGSAVAEHGFSGSFSEHGYVIGLVNVRADLSYYQGVPRLWNRSTKWDFYWPEFAHLGEQAVLTREIHAEGSGSDVGVFGYQERWAEYRTKPSLITGLFRGNAAGTLDYWHLAQRLPAGTSLNDVFLLDESDDVLRRALAAGAAADGQQILFDAFFDISRIRAIPTFSVPGLVDHF